MPEGHLIHRYAREQHTSLAGQVLTMSSPQGRVDTGPYDGRPLHSVEAYGKHLLYHVTSPSGSWPSAATSVRRSR